MLFCDIYYVSKDAAYIKKLSEVILFFHIGVMFVIVELQTCNAILLTLRLLMSYIYIYI